MLTLGAGIGLMSVSVIITDCIMLNCTKEKKLYQKVKELEVKEVMNLVGNKKFINRV